MAELCAHLAHGVPWKGGAEQENETGEQRETRITAGCACPKRGYMDTRAQIRENIAAGRKRFTRENSFRDGFRHARTGTREKEFTRVQGHVHNTRVASDTDAGTRKNMIERSERKDTNAISGTRAQIRRSEGTRTSTKEANSTGAGKRKRNIPGCDRFEQGDTERS